MTESKHLYSTQYVEAILHILYVSAV